MLAYAVFKQDHSRDNRSFKTTSEIEGKKEVIKWNANFAESERG
jgi:hypothetical protein